MEFRKKIFSHFFSSKDEPSLPKATEILVEKSETPSPPSFDLIFPSEHSLYKLRQLWSNDYLNSPLGMNLLPNEKEGSSFSMDNTSYQIAILNLSLTRAADKRLSRAFSHADDVSLSDLDEEAFIYLSKDRMIAWLLLFPPINQGQELSTSQLEQILVQRGVTYGVNHLLLEQLPTMPDRYFQLFTIACGTAPISGTNGYIIDHFPRTLKPEIQVDDLGDADYNALNLVQDVQKNDIICDIIPPVEGIPGVTVSGNPLPAKKGIAAVIPQGRNTTVSEDGSHLIATCPGHIEFSGRNFQVKPVLEIFQSVDQSIGNLNFLGDIHIHGDVCHGFSVHAMGNIQVDGVIEDCMIEAGENIIVSSGVQGQDNAVLRAHKSIYAKYLERCSVYAQESVEADCIIDCNIYSNGTVKARTGRGIIIGGVIRSSQEVCAITVGSKAESPTSIILGGQPCESHERSQILAEVATTEHEISQLEQQADTPDKQKDLSKLRLNLYVVKMKLSKLDKDLADRFSQNPNNDKRHLICTDLYPGTIITIDRKFLRIEHVEHNCTIGLVNGLVRRM